MAATAARSRAWIAAARASSSATCWTVSLRVRAAETRSADATMRSRSNVDTSSSSGSDDPAHVGAPTGPVDEVAQPPVEPRELVGGGGPLGPGWDEAELVADPLDRRSGHGDPLGGLGRAGCERGARHQGAGQRVEQAARLGEAHRQRAARRQGQVLGRGGVEAAVDEGREPLGLPGPDPPAVEGRLEEGEPVANRLPEGQGHGEVGGDRDLLARVEAQRGGIDLVEVGPALRDPDPEGAEVGLGLGGVDGHAEAARGAGRREAAVSGRGGVGSLRSGVGRLGHQRP